MATVTFEDMQSKLLSLEEVAQVLQKTEPFSNEPIDSESKIRFRFDDEWSHGVDSLWDTELVNASMVIDGVERRLTKEAVFQAGANFGLPNSYMRKLPSSYVQGLLNYHYSNGMGSNSYNVFVIQDNIAAFTRPTLRPFSNLQLLEESVAGIRDLYGADTPIYADYKIANSLQRTDVRLIVPAQERIMRGTEMDDVPAGEDDTWMSGVHLSNSLIGKGQTTVEAYMFRWWCTNGCTTTMPGIGTWSRRSNGQDEGDVYQWARESVNEVLGGMEYLFDQVQALTQLNVSGDTADVLREIFSQYEVPVSQREAIMQRLLSLSTITMYSIMQAITQAANDPALEDRRKDRLMRIGGALPTKTFDTLKAQVWREGHSADPEAPNPYEPVVILSNTA